MRRKFITLHLDGKKLNTETVGTLQSIIEFAAMHRDPRVSINADKSLVITVQEYQEFSQ